MKAELVHNTAGKPRILISDMDWDEMSAMAHGPDLHLVRRGEEDGRLVDLAYELVNSPVSDSG